MPWLQQLEVDVLEIPEKKNAIKQFQSKDMPILVFIFASILPHLLPNFFCFIADHCEKAKTQLHRICYTSIPRPAGFVLESGLVIAFSARLQRQPIRNRWAHWWKVHCTEEIDGKMRWLATAWILVPEQVSWFVYFSDCAISSAFNGDRCFLQAFLLCLIFSCKWCWGRVVFVYISKWRNGMLADFTFIRALLLSSRGSVWFPWIVSLPVVCPQM